MKKWIAGKFTLLTCTLIAIFFSSIGVSAQIPTYKFTNFIPGVFSTELQLSSSQSKIQSTYTKGNFPGMPSGRVKAIYVRVGEAYTTTGNPSKAYYPQLTVKMGYSPDSTTLHDHTGVDTFRTGLTTLYGPDSFAVNGSDTAGAWVKIPFTKGNFTYILEQKFVVEISVGPQTAGNCFDLLASNSAGGVHFRSLNNVSNKNALTGNATQPIMDLGMDLGQPAGIEGSNVVITDVSVFPNPSTDGKFVISCEAGKPVNDATITVRNATGQQISRVEYHNLGTSFFKQLNLQDAAKGIYFIELAANGEHVVRRAVVE